jgi:3-oxo-5-alpha-steroid 4-dehydrogenase 1
MSNPLIPESTFKILAGGMACLAVVVFICLYFINAGYGQFRSKKWGLSIGNKAAWVLMEAPVFIVMALIWGSSGFSSHIPELVLLLLFEIHYFQRSFIFPLMLRGKSRMPVAIMLMGMSFNVINGILQGGGLYWYPNPDFSEGPSYLLRWNAIAGICLFFAGFAVNLHSDSVIRHLRKPGDTRHYLPSRGFYHYVTSANYFGEIVEWIGFALAAATPVAWVFPLWTAANLVPRSNAIHARYRDEFGYEAVGSRKRIIPFIY